MFHGAWYVPHATGTVPYDHNILYNAGTECKENSSGLVCRQVDTLSKSWTSASSCIRVPSGLSQYSNRQIKTIIVIFKFCHIFMAYLVSSCIITITQNPTTYIRNGIHFQLREFFFFFVPTEWHAVSNCCFCCTKFGVHFLHRDVEIGQVTISS